MKERYYSLLRDLKVFRGESGIERTSETYEYDFEHEVKRKAQLNLLWNRTSEQVF